VFNIKSFVTLSLGMGLLAGSWDAGAGVVTIDPDGLSGSSGAVEVGAIDFLPGNALNQGALTSNVFTNYFQARVGSLKDGNNNVIQIPGLNDAASSNSFEWTIVSEFDLSAISYYDSSSNLHTDTSLASGMTVNFLKIYYDPSMNSNDLTGTGFDDGTLILSGYATFFGGTFIEFLGIPATNLDQYGDNNYPGITSNTAMGMGAASVVAKVTETDSNFFKTDVAEMNFGTFNEEVYRYANPSQSFLGVTPDIGAVNSKTGPDILVATDAMASFVVPEPGVFMILGLSAAGLFIRRRK
jgi:hypothetical protein